MKMFWAFAVCTVSVISVIVSVVNASNGAYAEAAYLMGWAILLDRMADRSTEDLK